MIGISLQHFLERPARLPPTQYRVHQDLIFSPYVISMIYAITEKTQGHLQPKIIMIYFLNALLMILAQLLSAALEIRVVSHPKSNRCIRCCASKEREDEDATFDEDS